MGWAVSAEKPIKSKLLVDELGVGVELERWRKA